MDIHPSIIILDVETWASVSFAFGVLYYPEYDINEVYYSERDIKKRLESFIRYDKNAKKIKIFGHNIGYDLNWIYGNYEIFFSDEYKTDGNKKRYWKKLLSRDGHFYEAKLYNLIFLDTMNLFIGSLEKAGKMLGYEKDISKRSKFENNKTPQLITQDDIDYCLKDCIICYKLYKKYDDWCKENGIKLSRTISATALRLLKKINPDIIEYQKELCKNPVLSDLDESFKNAYYGGRTEVYKKSGSNLNYYDVNSLYPSVMSDINKKYPNPLTLFNYKGDIFTAINNYEGMTEIKIKCPENIKMPVLPTRNNAGKIIYPTGIISGSYCFPEIRLALKMGYIIIDVKNIICGHPIKPPFYECIKMLYDKRLSEKKNGNPDEEITKRYMNHLYGKFGQRDYQNKLILLSMADDLMINDNYEILYYKNIPYVRYITESKRSRADILCLASYVTSYARCKMYEYYGKCDYNIYYSDTDSILTNESLPTSDKMGDMKLEYKILYASFKGRKDYYLELENKSVIKRKGINLKMVSAMFHDGEYITVTDEIKERFKNGDKEIVRLYHESDIMEIERITKTREAINRGLDASHLITGNKSRLTETDDGRIWENEISIAINICDDISQLWKKESTKG